MKTSIAISTLMLLSATATAGNNTCYRECAAWDTFCKSPPQIVATKIRLGVPVKHEEAAALGIPSHYLVRGGGSLVPGLPCSELETNRSTSEIVADHL